MITVELGPSALTRVRLAYSPMWELTTSLRLLVHEPDSGRHRPWIRWAQPRVAGSEFAIVRELISNRHCYPDFLTPPPAARARSINAELAEVAVLDPDVIREQFDISCQGHVPAPVRQVLRGTDPMAALACALERYWQRVVAPVWPRIREVLSADLAYRADELAADGLHALLNRLHPMVSFTGDVLRVDMRHHDITRVADTVDQLALVPSAFAWPEMLIVVGASQPVTMSYGPRGAAGLWRRRDHHANEPLTDLVGRSRAQVLTLLDLPVSTSQIAEQTGLTLSAVSQQLSVLRAAGLVETRRSGRTAWSVRTGLGSRLLDGSPEIDHE